MNKCAPGIDYKHNSCFTLDNLIEISNEFNSTYPNKKFKIINDKKYLLKNLIKVMNNTYNCSDEICWLETKLLKNINNKDILSAHKPQGPTNFEWLSTTNINDVLYQYEKTNLKFKYLGTVPIDFEEIGYLESIGITDLNSFSKKYNKFGVVINLDEHNKSGSHWVSLYGNFNTNEIYFFDSFGKKPKKRIRIFIKKIFNQMYKNMYNKDIDYNNLSNINFKNFKIKYNKNQHQFKNSECGVYSINFIIRLLNGEKFNNITNNILKDNFMNNCRKTYFRGD